MCYIFLVFGSKCNLDKMIPCQKAMPMRGLCKKGCVILIALFILLPGRVVSAGDRGQIARQAVSAFYDLYLETGSSSGVPTGRQLLRLKPVVSKDLFSLLTRAGRAEAYYKKKTKGESPPLVEGDLFTSLFEGASGYEVKQCDTRGVSAECIVELRYVDPNDKSVVSWTDKVFLVREGRRMVVDDIEYLGTWEFMHKGRLKDLLRQVIVDSRE